MNDNKHIGYVFHVGVLVYGILQDLAIFVNIPKRLTKTVLGSLYQDLQADPKWVCR